jgi:hypothetical protein
MTVLSIRNLLFAALIFLVAPMAANAQDEAPKFDLFVGPSLLRDDFNVRYETLGGVHVAGTYNFTDKFGIEGEFAGYYGDHAHGSLMAGPKFTARGKKASGFGHALFGLVGTSDVATYQMAIGGGVDVRLNDRLDVRVVQADWIRIGFSNHSNDVRVSAGLVIKF